MSKASSSLPIDDTQTRTIDDRIRELEEIRDELELVATTDVPYAKHARGFLQTLEEVTDDE